MLKSVEANTVLSSSPLPFRVQAARNLEFVGSDEFVLYNVAMAEQYIFAGKEGQAGLASFLWVQFEGHLESNQHTYDYSSEEVLEIASMRFYRTFGRSNWEDESRERPDSDTAHMFRLFKDRGHNPTGEYASERLVWLDSARLNEVMIVYSEKLPIELESIISKGNKLDAQTKEGLAKSVHERTLASFALVP